MSVQVKRLINLKGAEKFGACNSCGRISSEDNTLVRITFSTLKTSGTSICLCRDCANTLTEMLKGDVE